MASVPEQELIIMVTPEDIENAERLLSAYSPKLVHFAAQSLLTSIMEQSIYSD